MFKIHSISRMVAGSAVAILLAGSASLACADDIIKLGLSIPLSGAAANWGKGSEWLCNAAAREIAEEGGVKVGGKVYNYKCVAFDNKYNAAEGTKVAQTLLNREGIKFIGGSLGTAPVKALQSLSEREGALHFTTAWGRSIKGPKFPLTFTIMNTPNEIAYALTRYVKEAHPAVKSVALLNPNDATGQETEMIARAAWSAVGVKVVSSDWYDRGTTEFQPIASKMAATKADLVDLGATPPADSGIVFKELQVIGWKGVRVVEVGTGAEGIVATGGAAVEDTYMGAAVVFDSALSTPKQRKLNEGGHAAIGENLNSVQIAFYDSVKALKAAMELSQSIDPKVVAAALPRVKFESFYGTSGFGRKDTYGSAQQILIPVIVTQIKGGKLIEVKRIEPEEMKQKK
ncbi:MAG: ABC transporter substrate-binding protein [Pseudomonadota bacterium]